MKHLLLATAAMVLLSLSLFGQSGANTPDARDGAVLKRAAQDDRAERRDRRADRKRERREEKREQRRRRRHRKHHRGQI